MKHFLTVFFAVFLNGLLLQAQDDCFSLYVSSAQAQAGEQVCLDVRAMDNLSFLSFQFSLNWDANALAFQSLDNLNLPGLTESVFNTNNNGILTVAWFDASFATAQMEPDEVLFSVCYDVLTPIGAQALVAFSQSPTPVEFVDGEFNLINNYSLISGSVYTTGNAPPQLASACVEAQGCQAENGILISMATPGSYTFEWSQSGINVANTQNLMDVIGGQYQLYLADANDAILTGLFNIDPPGGVDFYLNATNANCANGNSASVFAGVSGGSGSYTYNWNNGGTEPFQANLPSGVYCVTITDLITGCSASDCIIVSAVSGLGISSDVTPAYCNFGVGSIDLTVGGGTAPYFFQWSNGASTEDLVGLIPGNYTVTVTDVIGCTGVAEITVPYVDEVYFDSQVSQALCDGTGGAILIDVPDFGIYTYQWSDGATTEDRLNLSAGTYTLTITEHQQGCSSEATFEVEATNLVVGFSYDCNNDNGNWLADVSAVVWNDDTQDYTFNWSTGFTETSNFISTLIGVPGNATYSLTVTNEEGCSYISEPLYVDCFSNPELTTGYSVDCFGSGSETMAEITLEVLQGGTPPFSFAWSNGITTTGNNSTVATVPGNAIYTVTITDANGIIYPVETVIANCGGNSGDGVGVIISSASVVSGEAFCLDVTVENFENIAGAQFSIQWDAAYASLEEVIPGTLSNLNMTAFNTDEAANGLITFAWYDPTTLGQNLTDGAVLFSLCFEALNIGGITPVLVSNQPTLIEFTDGFTIFPYYLHNGEISVSAPDVWPGDTDTDQVVSHFDLLNIGLGYGLTGVPRATSSIAWDAQFSDNWGQNTPVSLVDYKHADTNGDGQINTADTLAIHQNWDLTVNLVDNPEGLSNTPPTRNAGALIYVEPHAVIPGESAIFNIVMESTEAQMEPVYGLAFSIVYDTAAVEAGTAYPTFGESWLGEWNDNLISMSKEYYQQGRLDIAVTRTDGENVAGEGIIGQLHITIQDVIFMRTTSEYPLLFNIENLRLINNLEEYLAISSEGTTAIVDIPNALKQPNTDLGIEVFPNPVAEVLHIRSTDSWEGGQLLHLDGKNVLSFGQVDKLDMAHLPKGTYLLRLFTTEGVVVKRIVLQ
ncbi:MAG TPA: cohesin domain-containing protein [Saprospiraceae bacterium]|nr:cohesin domain-containing protein [Saprospiraceae bacterium]HMQ84934.1 cohesin domain-containing protein [Saprospiraceae bacterium]